MYVFTVMQVKLLVQWNSCDSIYMRMMCYSVVTLAQEFTCVTTDKHSQSYLLLFYQRGADLLEFVNTAIH